MEIQHLACYLEASAERHPKRLAVIDPDGTGLTYGELNRQADAVAALLTRSGVNRGDRVGILLPKSAAAVVSLYGVVKAGAAYVPVDCTAPIERSRRILTDCGVRAVILVRPSLGALPRVEETGAALASVIVVDDDAETASPDERMVSFARVVADAARVDQPAREVSDLAYILYTSGSTGTPKGVMLTHENASSFVEWSSSIFHPTEEDRFSSHAPFHFDLSVLDIYVAAKHGAALHLISESVGKSPRDLARFIAERRLTVWYPTPSILTFLLQFGNLSAHDVSSLRLVLFAGEVFSVKHLRELRRCLPGPDFYNLYGPTETNVCTFARIPAEIPDERVAPYPIGFLCAHCDGMVLDESGCEAPTGTEGLLYISGPSVFQGYWNRPNENAAAFVQKDGRRWYNTGDLVRWDNKEGYRYSGRRDRMVKRRGYRIELGEIERALYLHPAVREAAVVSVPDTDAAIRIVAFIACPDEGSPSIIELKSFCARALPSYMSPDRFIVRSKLEKTSTDKVDYQALKAEATEVRVA